MTGDTGGWGQNETLFLSTQSIAGNLVIVAGFNTVTGSIISYTPASGKTFTLYSAICRITGGTANVADLRNNSTIRDKWRGSAAQTGTQVPSIVKGDTLVGDGAKTYDINLTTADGTIVTATIVGYIQ